MKALDQTGALEELCRATKKWGLYISIFRPEEVPIPEVAQACSFLDLDIDAHGQITIDESGYFLFDTEKDMERHFDMCVGDDGPTELNKYSGRISVYALTCDPNGGTLDENT